MESRLKVINSGILLSHGLFMVSSLGFPALASMARLMEFSEQDTGDAPKCLSTPHTVCSLIL